MTISVSGTVNEGVQAQCPFPLYILLARLVSITEVVMHSLKLIDILIFVYIYMYAKILRCGRPKIYNVHTEGE